MKSALIRASFVAVMTTLVVAGCGKSTDDAIPPSPTTTATQAQLRPDDIVRGNPKAPVTFIEYASMTCPHCGRWQQEVMPKLVENYINTGKVRYIFREFPLDFAARTASALARCQKGDAFYAMIDLIFHDQEQWIKDSNGDTQITKEDIVANLGQEAAKANMAKAQAEACMNDPKNLAIVDANTIEAQSKYNINSTPTFIIVGGEQHVGEWKWEELDAALKARLAAVH